MTSTHSDASDALWSVELGQPPTGPPLVAGDLLLVPSQQSAPPAQHAILYALSLADGSLRWQRPFEYALVSGLAQPCEGFEPSQGLILVSTTSTDLMHGQGALMALDGEGEERWRWAPGVQRVSAPAVTGVKACVTIDARTLVVLDLATGEEQHRVALEANASLSAPALAGDVAYVPCRAPDLLAVGLDHGTRWHFTAQDGLDTWLDKTPVVVGEHVFAVLTTGAVLALQAEDGSLAWRVNVGPAGKPLSPPVTDGERLFVGARDGLHALSPSDGHELWTFPTERRITAAPIAADGVVYAGCHDHLLYALDGATGRELWRYEAERRIEVSPALAACADPPRPCVLIADRGGTLTAVARPLSAADHEAAGRWVEAASVYADLGQLARGAQLLEDHDEHLKAAELWEAAGERERAAAQYEAAGHWVEAASTYAAAGQPARGVQLLEDHDEPLRAAELWETAGEQERAAAQYEIAGAWARAAELWAGLGRTLKWAEALEQHARSLEGEVCGAKERAAAWEAAAVVFDAEGERERAAAGRREVARCLSQPIISVDVELDKGLMLHAWSRLQFIVRNDGFGPARNLVIRASGNEFEGQVTVTRRIIMLPVGRESIDWLSVRPLEYGDSVPLQVAVEFENQAGETCVLEQAIHVPVARSEADRGAGGVSSLFQPSGGLDYEGGLHRLRDKLTEDAPALLPEFYALEARLLDNLRGERLYGSTETVRAERARVLHALNDLAVRARLGPSFNDLCRR